MEAQRELGPKVDLLNVWSKSRREIAERYYEKLSDIEEIKLPVREKGHVYHLFVIQAKERDKQREQMGSNGIKCWIHYPVPIPIGSI